MNPGRNRSELKTGTAFWKRTETEFIFLINILLGADSELEYFISILLVKFERNYCTFYKQIKVSRGFTIVSTAGQHFLKLVSSIVKIQLKLCYSTEVMG